MATLSDWAFVTIMCVAIGAFTTIMCIALLGLGRVSLIPALLILGPLFMADGIGSILKQPTQPLLWWQVVRILRTVAGVIVLTVGLLLI